MASKVNIVEAKERLCAIEQEALLSLDSPVQSLALPTWNPRGVPAPFWMNRVVSVSVIEGYADDYGEELSLYRYTLGARLVVAHITADYEGEVSEANDLFLPQVIEYLDARELLQSGAFLDPLAYLVRAHFIQGTGFTAFPLSVAGTAWVGADFQWDCDFVKQTIQAYI